MQTAAVLGACAALAGALHGGACCVYHMRRMTHGSTASSIPGSRGAVGIRNGLVRAVVVAAGAGVCACAALPAAGFMGSVRGVPAGAVAGAVHPVQGVLAIACVLAVCTVVACLLGRLLNAAIGVFVLGCGVAMLSMRTGTVADAAFDGLGLRAIAVETLVWAGVVLALVAIVFRVSGPLPDIPAREPGGTFLHEVFNADAWRGLLAGVAVVVVVWLLMRNDLKGQALGSAVCAGVVTAFAGRKLQGRAQPILLMAAPVLAVALAQLWSAFTSNPGVSLAQLVVGHALPGWSRIMPVDIAAGALIGVPIGLGWSRSTPDEPGVL